MGEGRKGPGMYVPGVLGLISGAILPSYPTGGAVER